MVETPVSSREAIYGSGLPTLLWVTVSVKLYFLTHLLLEILTHCFSLSLTLCLPVLLSVFPHLTPPPNGFPQGSLTKRSTSSQTLIPLAMCTCLLCSLQGQLVEGSPQPGGFSESLVCVV